MNRAIKILAAGVATAAFGLAVAADALLPGGANTVAAQPAPDATAMQVKANIAVNGGLAPAGTRIELRIDETTCGGATLAGATSFFSTHVRSVGQTPNCGTDGLTVGFVVLAPDGVTAITQATPPVTFVTGGSGATNLTVTAEYGTSSPTPTATPMPPKPMPAPPCPGMPGPVTPTTAPAPPSPTASPAATPVPPKPMPSPPAPTPCPVQPTTAPAPPSPLPPCPFSPGMPATPAPTTSPATPRPCTTPSPGPFGPKQPS